jgi:hypothetical protein
MASGEKHWKERFKDLALCCGIGFDPLWTFSGLIETDQKRGTLDKTVFDCLAEFTKLGDTMRDRQLCVVPCSSELGHDLMTSPKFNLSCMPRFEAAGMIPHEKDDQ